MMDGRNAEAGTGGNRLLELLSCEGSWVTMHEMDAVVIEFAQLSQFGQLPWIASAVKVNGSTESIAQLFFNCRR